MSIDLVKFLKGKKVLISACLLGENCRYNGQSKPNKAVIELSKKLDFVPVYPEVMGGLPTPRSGAERAGKKVMANGSDVTEEFEKGAEEVLKIVKDNDIKYAILKQRSPSCGSGQIYREGQLIEGDRVAAELLKSHGVKVISEEDVNTWLNS